jgi:hypothetical protein
MLCLQPCRAGELEAFTEAAIRDAERRMAAALAGGSVSAVALAAIKAPAEDAVARCGGFLRGLLCLAAMRERIEEARATLTCLSLLRVEQQSPEMGLGVRVACAVARGTLVTFYGCDHGRAAGHVFSLTATGVEAQAALQRHAMQPNFRDDELELIASAECDDAAMLGHMVNDGALPDGNWDVFVAELTALPHAAQRAALCAALLEYQRRGALFWNCRFHAVPEGPVQLEATRDIAAGEWLSVSYGLSYVLQLHNAVLVPVLIELLPSMRAEIAALGVGQFSCVDEGEAVLCTRY